MTNGPPRIAIVGAGIGGLTAALVLTRFGFHVAVYEQARAFARVGAGIQVSPNASRILDRLGLLRKLQPLACRPTAWRSYTFDTGAVLAELPLGDSMARRYGAPYLQLHRGDLHQALADAVPRSRLHLGHRCLGFEQHSSGVELDFEGGGSATADVLVSADGIHSIARERLVAAGDVEFSGKVAYRGIVPAARLAHLKLEILAAKWWGVDRHFVHYFISGGREVNFVAVLPAEDWRIESWSTRGDLKQLLAELDGFHDTVSEIVRPADEVYKWAIYDRRPLPFWSQGSVTLLGDACHPMVPFMAQGASSAMEDAVVLGRCLKSEADIPAALQKYEQARLPRTSALQAGARRNSFLKSDPSDGDWVYGYDAWETPLAARHSRLPVGGDR